MRDDILEQTPDNHHSGYKTAAVYSAFLFGVPSALTAFNALACYEPHAKLSLGRVYLGLMGWEKNELPGDAIMTSTLTTTPAALLIIAAIYLLHTHYNIKPLSPHQDPPKTATEKAEALYDNRVKALVSFSHAIVSMNIPLLLAGVFLHAFYAEKQNLESAAYMAITPTLGTISFTFFLYVFFAASKCSSCCAPTHKETGKRPTRQQLPARSNKEESKASNHVVIQVQPAPTHQRTVSNADNVITTRVFEHERRGNAIGQRFSQHQRITQHQHVQTSSNEQLQASPRIVNLSENSPNLRHTRLPGYINSQETIVENSMYSP